MEIGPRTAAVLDEVWQASRYRSDDSLVFCHPALGTPLDPTKLSRDYMRPALKAAGITKPFRPWHDLRHTALTHEAAAGNPHAYVQAKAGAQPEHDHRPLHPRSAGALPWRSREGGGAHVRRRRVANPGANAPATAQQERERPRFPGLLQ
jgi:hypothetical protein